MISHRYDRLHLLPSDPGGVQRELVVPDLPGAKVVKNLVWKKCFPELLILITQWSATLILVFFKN